MQPKSVVHNDENDEEKDDFFVLSHLFALPELNYVDVARKEKIPQVLQRWPLFAELARSAG